jgi:hypothetical protein
MMEIPNPSAVISGASSQDEGHQSRTSLHIWNQSSARAELTGSRAARIGAWTSERDLRGCERTRQTPPTALATALSSVSKSKRER